MNKAGFLYFPSLLWDLGWVGMEIGDYALPITLSIRLKRSPLRNYCPDLFIGLWSDGLNLTLFASIDVSQSCLSYSTLVLIYPYPV